MVGCQNFFGVLYISMLYPGRFILIESVHVVQMTVDFLKSGKKRVLWFQLGQNHLHSNLQDVSFCLKWTWMKKTFFGQNVCMENKWPRFGSYVSYIYRRKQVLMISSGAKWFMLTASGQNGFIFIIGIIYVLSFYPHHVMVLNCVHLKFPHVAMLGRCSGIIFTPGDFFALEYALSCMNWFSCWSVWNNLVNWDSIDLYAFMNNYARIWLTSTTHFGICLKSVKQNFSNRFFWCLIKQSSQGIKT